MTKKSFSRKSKPKNKKKSLKRNYKRKSVKSQRLLNNNLKNIVIQNYIDNYLSIINEFENTKDLLNYFYEKCNKITNRYAKTWNDYILLNIAFLHNYFLPFYTFGFLFKDHEKSNLNLIKLHEFGVFTIEGQGNFCSENEKQRSYLNCILNFQNEHQVLLINKLIETLKKDSRIFINFYNQKTDEYFDNTVYYVQSVSGKEQFFNLTDKNGKKSTNHRKLDKETFKLFFIEKQFYTFY